MLEVALIICVFVFIALGVVFVFAPGLPGPLVAWAGTLIYLLCTQNDVPAMGWLGVSVCGVLAGTSFVVDYLASVWGAKKFGGTWRGALGAFLGAIICPILLAPIGWILGAIVGVIVGPAIGAFLFEWLWGEETNKSAKIAWGAFVGGVVTFVVKMIVVMIIFVYTGTCFIAATL